MDTNYINGYRISGNKRSNMKLKTLPLSDNEVLDMMKKYKYDGGDTNRTLENSFKKVEKNSALAENQNDSVKNYFDTLTMCSNKELLKLLYLVCKKEKTIFKFFKIILSFLLVIICKFFSSFSLVRMASFSLGILLLLFPIFIIYNFNNILKKISYTLKITRWLIATFFGIIVFVWIFNDAYNLIVSAHEIKIDRTGSEYKLGSNLSQIRDDNNQVVDLDKEKYDFSKFQYEENFIQSITDSYDTIGYGQKASLSYDNNYIIAKNNSSGEMYTISELSGQKLLIPYEEEGKKILFYGQYNENKMWDGICVFNIYIYDYSIDSDILESILEAEYKNGKLESYKKVSKATTAQGIDVWSFSDRKIENGYNSGETWNYYRVNNYVCDFDMDEAKEDDVKNIDDFEKNLKLFSFLEGYYNGNTSNGYYNDETGNAYMIKFSENGVIRALYAGYFKDGFLDDDTGSSWEIVFDSSNNINRYFYYEGVFVKGHRKDNNGIEYISQEDINSRIKDMTINCELKWYGDTDSIKVEY